MLDHEFQEQFARLMETYGQRAFPNERNRLIYNAVIDLEKEWFKRLVDHMLGSMRQPPMVQDFREAAIKERKRAFDLEVSQAASKWDTGDFNGLPKYLASIGCSSLTEAVEKERRKIKSSDNSPKEQR